MRTRFKKVWCGKCSMMQFAGECGHAREVVPPPNVRTHAYAAEKGPRLPGVIRKLLGLFAPPPGEK